MYVCVWEEQLHIFWQNIDMRKCVCVYTNFSNCRKMKTQQQLQRLHFARTVENKLEKKDNNTHNTWTSARSKLDAHVSRYY